MKSLQEVLEGIEAFKKDMEDLGVDVMVVVAGDYEKVPLEGRVTFLALLQMDIGEDLEEG